MAANTHESALSTFIGRLEEQEAAIDCLTMENTKMKKGLMNSMPAQERTIKLFMGSLNSMLVSPIHSPTCLHHQI